MTDPKMSKKQVLEIIEASLEKAIDKVAYARINTYDAGRGTGRRSLSPDWPGEQGDVY